MQGPWIKHIAFFKVFMFKYQYYPMPEIPNYICASAIVLPSMRKDCDYNITILIHESTACIVKAYYNCPAGISATLYCLEDYIHLDYRMMNER